MQRCMMSTGWIGPHTSFWDTICLTEVTLTSQGSIGSTCSGISSSSGRKASPHTRLSTGRAYFTKLRMFSKTRVSASQRRRSRRSTLESSEESSTMPLNFNGALFTTRTLLSCSPGHRPSLYKLGASGAVFQMDIVHLQVKPF